MISENKLKTAFSQIKSDMTLLNGELALAHERIAKLESILIRESVKGTLDLLNTKTVKTTTKKKKAVTKKKPVKKKVKYKEITWNDHVNAIRRKFPKLTLKESLEIASKTWKKKKTNSKKK